MGNKKLKNISTSNIHIIIYNITTYLPQSMNSNLLTVESKTSLTTQSRSISRNKSNPKRNTSIKSKLTKKSTKDTLASHKVSRNSKNLPTISKICSIEDLQPIYIPSLSSPWSYKNTEDLLDALRDEMTLKINEASKLIINMGDKYSFFFNPSEHNLTVFRGLAALISQNVFTENTLESLPWTDYQ